RGPSRRIVASSRLYARAPLVGGDRLCACTAVRLRVLLPVALSLVDSVIRRWTAHSVASSMVRPGLRCRFRFPISELAGSHGVDRCRHTLAQTNQALHN